CRPIDCRAARAATVPSWRMAEPAQSLRSVGVGGRQVWKVTTRETAPIRTHRFFSSFGIGSFSQAIKMPFPIRPAYHARKPAMTAEALHHTDASPRPAAPAVARSRRSETEPESCEPELALWVAAL